MSPNSTSIQKYILNRVASIKHLHDDMIDTQHLCHCIRGLYTERTHQLCRFLVYIFLDPMSPLFTQAVYVNTPQECKRRWKSEKIWVFVNIWFVDSTPSKILYFKKWKPAWIKSKRMFFLIITHLHTFKQTHPCNNYKLSLMIAQSIKHSVGEFFYLF